MIPNNYVTFKCSKYSLIHRENNYCKEEELFGNYLCEEFDKRGNYIKQSFFTDFGFQIYFKVNKKVFYSLLTVIDDEKLKYGLGTSSNLNSIERFLGVQDEKEHLYVNQIIDDILHLNKEVSEITWRSLSKEELNQYEGKET